MSTRLKLPPLRPITQDNPYRLVFVCLGNICRSPTGEGIFQHLVKQDEFDNYFEIDSAGTSAFHAGQPANIKSAAVAETYGVPLLSRARQFRSSDLDYYDLILAMDHENRDELLAMAKTPAQKERIQLLRDYDDVPEDGQVPDPYYGGAEGFQNVYTIVERSCKNLLQQLKPQLSS